MNAGNINFQEHILSETKIDIKDTHIIQITRREGKKIKHRFHQKLDQLAAGHEYLNAM